MGKKVSYRHTENEDCGKPNNNYDDEIVDEMFGDGYTFDDWFMDAGVNFERVGNTYYVLDDGERTGEAYLIITE
jgi:hypothetical protein